jgi:hypothetical protein
MMGSSNAHGTGFAMTFVLDSVSLGRISGWGCTACEDPAELVRDT